MEMKACIPKHACLCGDVEQAVKLSLGQGLRLSQSCALYEAYLEPQG